MNRQRAFTYLANQFDNKDRTVFVLISEFLKSEKGKEFTIKLGQVLYPTPKHIKETLSELNKGKYYDS